MRESYGEKIAPVVAERWAEERDRNGMASERTKEPKAGFRAQVARELFAALPLADQKALSERAKAEGQEAKAAYTATQRQPRLQRHAKSKYRNLLNVRNPRRLIQSL
jgi:hypothetical protein